MASQEETLTQKLQYFTGDLSVQRLVDFCEHARYDHSEELTTSQSNKLALGIMGAMVESNLESGSQSFPQPKENLRFGVSITDGCIGWDTTEKMVREIHAALATHFA